MQKCPESVVGVHGANESGGRTEANREWICSIACAHFSNEMSSSPVNVTDCLVAVAFLESLKTVNNQGNMESSTTYWLRLITGGKLVRTTNPCMLRTTSSCSSG